MPLLAVLSTNHALHDRIFLAGKTVSLAASAFLLVLVWRVATPRVRALAAAGAAGVVLGFAGFVPGPLTWVGPVALGIAWLLSSRSRGEAECACAPGSAVVSE